MPIGRSTAAAALDILDVALLAFSHVTVTLGLVNYFHHCT
jgi:hypothetical protein